MLAFSVVILSVSALFAVIAVLASLGFGGRMLPGYNFHARGKEAVKWERKLLANVAYLLWSFSVVLASVGVAAFFLDLKQSFHVVILCVLGAVFVIVGIIWALYLSGGILKTAAKNAKELSE
ncbi:MAG: hypothetical protein J6Z34_01730 [Clostridia bacterium]|nr:hypothetical protein [Clostridia bacterium]